MKFKFKYGQLVRLKARFRNGTLALRHEPHESVDFYPRIYDIHPGQVGTYIADHNRPKSGKYYGTGPRMVVLFGEDMVEVEHKYLEVVK